MKEEKINVSTFNWGPCVIKLKVTDEFKNLLSDEGVNPWNIDFRNKLAGIIENEKGYSEAAKQKVLPYMSQYLGIYDEMYQKFMLKSYDKKPEYVMSALWINFQKANEFNPPHDHDGKLSFVIYLQIPEKLKEEHKNYKGKSCGPGGIQFLWGDGPRDCVSYQSYFPEEGDMFIFPAWLKHWVAPFRSDCTRISVSGNVHDSAPLNAIQNFAPEYLKDKDEKAR